MSSSIKLSIRTAETTPSVVLMFQNRKNCVSAGFWRGFRGRKDPPICFFETHRRKINAMGLHVVWICQHKTHSIFRGQIQCRSKTHTKTHDVSIIHRKIREGNGVIFEDARVRSSFPTGDGALKIEQAVVTVVWPMWW